MVELHILSEHYDSNLRLHWIHCSEVWWSILRYISHLCGFIWWILPNKNIQTSSQWPNLPSITLPPPYLNHLNILNNPELKPFQCIHIKFHVSPIFTHPKKQQNNDAVCGVTVVCIQWKALDATLEMVRSMSLKWRHAATAPAEAPKMVYPLGFFSPWKFCFATVCFLFFSHVCLCFKGCLKHWNTGKICF